MGLFKTLKNIFSKKSKTKGEKVKVDVKPETVISNLGTGDGDMDIQTTLNSDGIDVLVEEGDVENVSN